jgi:uncharacterized membrane protein YtjA (UPF0391 family)
VKPVVRRVSGSKNNVPEQWSSACYDQPGLVEKENVMLTALASVASTALLAQVGGVNLLWIAIVFFIIAIIAYVLGARGVAGMSAGIGRTLLFVFLVLAIIFVIVGLVNRA